MKLPSGSRLIHKKDQANILMFLRILVFGLFAYFIVILFIYAMIEKI